MIGNPKECCDLGIAGDALIDVAIRDGIDLADARPGLLVRNWSNPRAQRHGHSVEGADPAPSAPPVTGDQQPCLGSRGQPSSSGFCTAYAVATWCRGGSDVIIDDHPTARVRRCHGSGGYGPLACTSA
jgi:hypothetical protein